MKFLAVTYVGLEVDDSEILSAVPPALGAVLQQANGLIAYDGGLHIRGACREPDWHALRHAWHGPLALHELYPAVHEDDVPFAEDAVGDQWLLRAGEVWRLDAETGELTPLQQTLGAFLAAAEATPVTTLRLQPLIGFQQRGGALAPGELINVYPPFCTLEAGNGVEMAAVPAVERRVFLAELARQLPADGAFRVVVDTDA